MLNALNRQTIVDLLALMEDLRADTQVSGVVLTGAGDRAFAAGADINELARMSPVEAQALSGLGHALMDAIGTLGKPVVAAVNGYALGGGCELAVACTVRIASENAVFGQPEVTLGLIPGYGGSQRLPRLIGKGRAMQMVLTGKSIHAAEAYRIGLVNEVVAPGELLARAEAMVASMTVNAPVALRLALEAVNAGLDSTLADGCTLEAALFGLCAATQDRTEGTAAFPCEAEAGFRRPLTADLYGHRFHPAAGLACRAWAGSTLRYKRTIVRVGSSSSRRLAPNRDGVVEHVVHAAVLLVTDTLDGFVVLGERRVGGRSFGPLGCVGCGSNRLTCFAGPAISAAFHAQAVSAALPASLRNGVPPAPALAGTGRPGPEPFRFPPHCATLPARSVA